MSETSFFLSHIESFAELGNSPSGTDFLYFRRVEIVEIVFYSSLITTVLVDIFRLNKMFKVDFF